MSIIVILLGEIYISDKYLLYISYAYLVLGTLTLIPFLYLIIRNRRALPKLLKASLFFIPLYFIYELTALHLDQWRFPGQYIGLMTIIGQSIPFEELFFWIFASSTIVLSYYELYVDDMK